MVSIEKLVNEIPDVTAQRILRTIVRSRASGFDPITWTGDLRHSIVDAFDLSPDASVSEGEIVRQSLLLLAEDADTRNAIAVMASRPEESVRKFDAGANIAIATAVLFVLQTHIEVERDKTGKWTFRVEKKPTSGPLLKGFLQKLVAFLPR